MNCDTWRGCKHSVLMLETMLRFFLALTLLCLPTFLINPKSTSAQTPCSVILQPGNDIGRAASQGRVVCLTAGTYNPFVVDRTSVNGVTVVGLDPGRTFIQTSSSADIVVYGAQGVTLRNFTVRGPKGIYVSRSSGVTLDGLRVDDAALAVHVDENSTATLSNVTIARPGEVGLLVRNGASVDGRGVSISDAALVGVAAVKNAASLTLHDSEVARAGKGPGIFAGITGCAELAAATLDISPCFFANAGSYISRTQVVLERVNVHDGPGTGLVFFPGVSADVRGSQITGWGLTGMFAWGSTVNVSGSTFDVNEENAIEYRAFPDPRSSILLRATGNIWDTTIRRTKPYQGNVLGGGVVAQGADLSFLRSTISENAAFGLVYDNGAAGQIVDSRIVQNADTGVCALANSRVDVRTTEITGNYNNDPRACAA